MSSQANTSRTVFLCLLLVTSWVLMHHYALTGDGELYAVQALARINPALNSDIYLSATSQDKYTLFSPLYAWTIRLLGLQNAGAVLFAACTFSLVAAAWVMARQLWDESTAWLAAGMLIIAASNYGAYGVFQYAESYLTARTMAEALVVLSLAAYFLGFAKLAWVIAALSMFIHPLMTLPGLLLLGCLSTQLRHAFAGAAAGLTMAILMVVAATTLHLHSTYLTVVSGQWLDMIRERSQFLFLRYWRLADWETHARVLLSLTLSALSATDLRIRRLCVSACLIGTVGLMVAWIAGSWGPVAILLQGQAWRWFWVTAFTAVIMLVPAAIRLWKDGGCGAMCAVLLIASWTFPPVNGAYLAAAALGLWTVRSHVRPPTQHWLKKAAYALIATILIWAAADVWSVCTNRPVIKTDEPLVIERLRSIWALQITVLMLLGSAVRWRMSMRAPHVTVAGTALLMAVCAFAIPGTFKQIGSVGTSAEIDAFSDWRAIIPPTANVLLVPKRNSAAFLWFSLQRPSYLTVDQSAGVVFSPVTSLEIRRRSEVLLPIEDADWRLLTQNTQKEKGEKIADQSRPLTAERLAAICADPQLGFVIAKESLGFNAHVRAGPGDWKGWNLYDCREVRKSGATA